MSKLLPFPNLREARHEAAQWVVRADRGLTPQERVEFDRWQAAPMNRRALRELGGLWGDMNSLQSLAELFPRDGRSAVAPRRVVRPWLAVAAALGVVAIGVTGYLRLAPHADAPTARPVVAQAESRVFETAVGANRTEALQDGSTLILNTDSQVSASFGAGHRDLTLARGEAHFQVAHDESSPFRVRVGNRVVQAVGTAFSIRLRNDGDVDVMVTDGTVKVLSAIAQDEAAPKLVTKQQLLTIDVEGHEQLRQVEAADLEMRLAWQRGMLGFKGETLPEVIAEFGRYTDRKIVIVDPSLRRERVGGYFRAGDVEGFLAALRQNFGIAADSDERGRILLTVAR
jgi:transmembrane sensor